MAAEYNKDNKSNFIEFIEQAFSFFLLSLRMYIATADSAVRKSLNMRPTNRVC